MLNPYIEDDSISSSSESEHGKELACLPGQSPAELTAHSPSVVIENSTDVHIGPRLQYNGPITVKQFITVSGPDNADNSKFALPFTKDISEKCTELHEIGLRPDGCNSSVEVITSDGLKNKEENVLCVYIHNRYLLITLIIILFICLIITLAVVLSNNEVTNSNKDLSIIPDMKENKIKLFCKIKDVQVLEGASSVQWVVDVISSTSEPTFEWYGPNCKKIEQIDGPSRYDVYVNQFKTQTVLKISNIEQKDRGLYRLRAYSDIDDQWIYLTLNVRGAGPQETDNVVVCYVAEWASRRVGLGIYTVDNIDPTLCSHLIYAFAGLNVTTSSIYSLTPSYDLGEGKNQGAYEKMTSFRDKYPHLKVLLSMGGWAERESKNYSIMAASAEKRQIFIQSASEFVRLHKFDGLDLHWQYPAEQHGRPPDKQNFVYLLEGLRKEFDKYGLLLTAPLGVIPDTIQHSYNIPAISQYLDYMFALCYSYHGFWDPQTGPNAPLYRIKEGDNLNVESSILTLLKKGAPAKKLVLGLAIYGRTFNLVNESDSEAFGGKTEGNGFFGPYVQEQGFLGYNEICSELGKEPSNWVTHWDNVSHTPFATRDKQFISYDNERSLIEKVELAVKKNLAGVAIWSLDTDDFRGECVFDHSGITNYPLVRAINKALYTASFEPNIPCVEPATSHPTEKSNETEV